MIAQDIDVLKAYFNDVHNIIRCSNEHEKELFEKIANGDNCAKQEIAESNLRLVISIAKKYTNHGVPFLDLIQEGNIGLMKAIDKYDPSLGYKFSTYATFWIQQTLGRAIADQGKTVRVPVHMVDTINRYKKELRALTTQLGREATYEDLAIYLNEPLNLIKDTMLNDIAINSLDTPLDDDNEETSFGDLIEDENFISPLQNIYKEELNDSICTILDTLKPQESTVIKMRYGINFNRPMTLQEIGNKLGLTRERVRQIESTAMEKLRNPRRTAILKNFLNEEEI